MGRKLTQIDGNTSARFATWLIVALLLITVTVATVLYHGSSEGDISDIIIPHGTSLARVSEILKEQGIVDRPTLLKILLRLTGGTSRVRAGEFRFRKNMRVIDAMWVFYHDAPIVHQVTIPEGFNVRQIAVLLASEKLVDEKRFLDLTLTPLSAKKYNLDAPNLEGFLYPETYTFSKVDGEEKIIGVMVQHFMDVYNKDLKADADAQKVSLLQLVTLASIIEKETGVDDERPKVSSVFHNRLKKKMKLQSDPTTIYGLTNYQGKLHKKDLLTPTAYNTYTISGLPPGPISNPGEASLKAALHPANTKFLYFVSNNQGSHIFSETYEQHSRHVNNYQVRKHPKVIKKTVD